MHVNDEQCRGSLFVAEPDFGSPYEPDPIPTPRQPVDQAVRDVDDVTVEDFARFLRGR
ncbi:hypothetical protein [Catenuloplanes japonicus]|uniref:hypothetical protein n=1 Tax=Catenuloplanes japonicus TaxID=33876 RepID=UPI000A962CD7|nr:hypothetical protein [Catenuloplanes japonicus]